MMFDCGVYSESEWMNGRDDDGVNIFLTIWIESILRLFLSFRLITFFFFETLEYSMHGKAIQ